MNESELIGKGMYTPKDVDSLKQQLQDEIKRAQKRDRDCDHKDTYSNPYSRECSRLSVMIEFLEQGVNIERIGGGLMQINNKFIISLANPKWRVKGKNKWYWYKNPEHFVRKYINREEGL